MFTDLGEERFPFFDESYVASSAPFRLPTFFAAWIVPGYGPLGIDSCNSCLLRPRHVRSDRSRRGPPPPPPFASFSYEPLYCSHIRGARVHHRAAVSSRDWDFGMRRQRLAVPLAIGNQIAADGDDSRAAPGQLSDLFATTRGRQSPPVQCREGGGDCNRCYETFVGLQSPPQFEHTAGFQSIGR